MMSGDVFCRKCGRKLVARDESAVVRLALYEAVPGSKAPAANAEVVKMKMAYIAFCIPCWSKVEKFLSKK